VIGIVEFGAGLGVIALQVRHSLQPAEIDAFHAALGERTTAAEWLAFCRAAAVRFGWKFLPTVGEVADALHEFRGAPPLEAEAATAYERVLAAGTYTPEGGTSWNWRDVVARCGKAAAFAFLEAGGHHAFASSYRESDRRERFVRAYVEAGRERPAERLLPAGAGSSPALPAGEEPLSEHEAAQAMRRIRELAGVAPERPKPKDGMVRASEERLAELRRQAGEITAAEPVASEEA
jgi:hypothetical protein